MDILILLFVQSLCDIDIKKKWMWMAENFALKQNSVSWILNDPCWNDAGRLVRDDALRVAQYWYWQTIHDGWFLLNEVILQSTKPTKRIYIYFWGHVWEITRPQLWPQHEFLRHWKAQDVVTDNTLRVHSASCRASHFVTYLKRAKALRISQ